ncbi:MAG: hypothetical protein E7513_03880 [Ruminococcaceae bacterium]|nr:hypothetical protein [Oscillospiraceae bacterium]
MKKIICLMISLLLTFTMCACSDKNGEQSDKTNDKVQSTVEYPVPEEVTFEKSENNLGARYTFTLQEFNDKLNVACKNIGTDSTQEFFDFTNWQIMSSELVDDNGIEYSSYYYPTDTLTITAAVENESNKVMNLGCGNTYEEFVNSDAEYQYTVMLTSAILAMVAGGYTEDDLEFLYDIFFDAAKNNVQFFYQNSVYMMNLSKAEGEEGSVVLFMTSPCKEKIKQEWELTDYSDFEGSYRQKSK